MASLYKVPGIKFLIHFDINGSTSRRWKTGAVSLATKPFFSFCSLGFLLFLNESPVIPHKRPSVKCMSSLENPNFVWIKIPPWSQSQPLCWLPLQAWGVKRPYFLWLQSRQAGSTPAPMWCRACRHSTKFWGVPGEPSQPFLQASAQLPSTDSRDAASGMLREYLRPFCPQYHLPSLH